MQDIGHKLSFNAANPHTHTNEKSKYMSPMTNSGSQAQNRGDIEPSKNNPVHVA